MKQVGIISTAALAVLLGITAPAHAQREQQGEKQDHADHQEGKREQHGQQQRWSREAPPQHAQQSDRGRQQDDRGRQQQDRGQRHGQDRQQQANRQDSPADRGQNHSRRTQENRPSDRGQRRRAQQQPQGQNRQREYARDDRSNARPQRSREEQRVQHSAWQEHRARSWQSDHRTWQQRGGYDGYRIPEERFRGAFGREHGFRIYGRPFLVVGGFPRFQYNGYWVSMVDPWPESWANNWYDTDDVYVTYVDNGYYLFNRRHPRTGIAISISL